MILFILLVYVMPAITVISWYLLAYMHSRGIHTKDTAYYRKGWITETLTFSLIPIINLVAFKVVVGDKCLHKRRA